MLKTRRRTTTRRTTKTRTTKKVSQLVQDYVNMRKFIWICEIAPIYVSLQESVQVCMNIHEFVRDCERISLMSLSSFRAEIPLSSLSNTCSCPLPCHPPPCCHLVIDVLGVHVKTPEQRHSDVLVIVLVAVLHLVVIIIMRPLSYKSSWKSQVSI